MAGGVEFGNALGKPAGKPAGGCCCPGDACVGVCDGVDWAGLWADQKVSSIVYGNVELGSHT
jgi:hypothetical protein